MQWIREEDRYYIDNKYHMQNEPFDGFKRMAYHGVPYPENGLDDEGMRELLEALTLEGLSHPEAKAKAFAAVTENARIDVNPCDWFVGFYNWGRPLSFVTSGKWASEVMARIPEEASAMKELSRSGAVAIWPDFDHVIPNWDALMEYGFPGLLERAKTYHERCRASGTMTPEQDAFYKGIEITYKAVLVLIDRYVHLAEKGTGEKSALQAQCMRRLRDGAPTNTYEALQAIYLFFILCECVDNYQTRSLGNGLDCTLAPFWRKDLDSGAFTETDLRGFVAYFLSQYASIGNYWGHPLYLGGTNADGSTKYNEVSEAILEVYGDLGIYNPKIQVKVNTGTPKKILYKVYDLIRTGISSFTFCCEPGMMKAVMSYGATEDEAREYEISGCYETRVRSDESSTGTGYVNALKAVELAMNNGIDPGTGLAVGIRTGELCELRTFNDFYHAVICQWMALVDKTIHIADSFEGSLEVINPSNMYSATVVRALKRGVDGYAKGVKFNNSSLLNCGFASMVDAVMAVKDLVWESGVTTLAELKAAMDADWCGYEGLRKKALECRHKYGSGDPETDRTAAMLARVFANRVNGRPNARGGVYKAIMHSARQFIIQGSATGATPDGRRAGEEESKNASPVNGMDRGGVTTLIRSVTLLEPWSYPESFCLDILLHPSAVAGDAGLAAMDALVMTYLDGGGMTVQFNVFSSATLRDAQEHPDRYKNLQVRVCGWNVLWNNLSREEQDAYILRAEKSEAASGVR